ncbi:MAG: 3-deoxy-D-manno-octulosonic acid transferase [Candidatus Omnitrophica bacterium]|nr:3-deoxy-D-manno-octulosonic acid transferase [Candidatus Omnitrophota bacterium]
MFILFDILFFIAFILYFPVLIWRGKWHAGFVDRFGFLSPAIIRTLSLGENVWLHAVSVGEAAALDGVIAALHQRFPEKRLVLTVSTKTGYAFAVRKYPSNVLVLWSPLDLSLTVDHFVRVIRPEIYIVAETELWPNLFLRLSADQVPIVVLNGRISDLAFPRYRRVKWFLRGMLRRVTVFGMQSRIDAERVIELGADPSAVRVMGNVKFDSKPAVEAVDPRGYGFEPEQQLILGGSTHPGEEEELLAIYCSLKAKHPLCRLVIAPRHPERSAEVAQRVREAGLNPVLFSRLKGILDADDVLVVDSIGHLLRFYSIAAIVFVGKSLTARRGGGQNIIEPAVFAKPIIMGTYTQNFRDITRAFLDEHAVIQVSDGQGLKAAVQKLLEDPALRSDLGARARKVVASHQGATERAVDLVADTMRSR